MTRYSIQSDGVATVVVASSKLQYNCKSNTNKGEVTVLLHGIIIEYSTIIITFLEAVYAPH